jgi:hypothetical protein
MYCIAAEQTGRCPLWVKSGHSPIFGRCPLYSRKRTLGLNREMSALWTQALQQTIPFIRWPNASEFRAPPFLPCNGKNNFSSV